MERNSTAAIIGNRFSLHLGRDRSFKGMLSSSGLVCHNRPPVLESQFPLPFGPVCFLDADNLFCRWDQGLLNMCIGEKRKLTIPGSLAYGTSRGIGSCKTDCTLRMPLAPLLPFYINETQSSTRNSFPLKGLRRRNHQKNPSQRRRKHRFRNVRWGLIT